MKRKLLFGFVIIALLSACGNKESEAPIVSQEAIQEHVQKFYNEMYALEQEAKSSVEKFNERVASYSAGEATDKQLQKGIKEFKDTAAELTKRAEKVKISPGLPADIKALLEESAIAFQSAYSLKEQASKSADSEAVTAEQFQELNQNTELAMLYGISKLNEARVLSGLLNSESAVETTLEAE